MGLGLEKLKLEIELEKLKLKKSSQPQPTIVNKRCDQISCGICNWENATGNVVWNCSHVFCSSCSDDWINRARNISEPYCPLCKKPYLYDTKITLNAY